MLLDGIGLFRGIMAKMSWLDQNQQVIAQNVANSDTPGYQPQTLKDVDFRSYMGPSAGHGGGTAKVSLAATDGAHMGNQTGGGHAVKAALKGQSTVYETSPNDNGVVLEEQLYKANQNSMQYQIASDIYRRSAGMIRMALQGSGR